MKTSLIAVLTLILAIPAFSSPKDKEVVTVNGVPIRQSEVMDRLWSLYGMPTLKQMIDEVLLRQEARSLKITARQKEIDERVGVLRSQFENTQRFKDHLTKLGTSLEGIKSDMAEQIVREKLVIKKHSLKVKEKELKEAFKKFKPRLGTPPAIHLRHIQVASSREAHQLVERIKAGADFKELARAHSTAQSGKIAGGDYGFVHRGLLPKDIEDIAFGMKIQELRIVPSSRGHHILQVLGRRAGEPAEYKRVKKDLRRLLMAEKISEVLPNYLEILRNKADIQPQGSSLP